MIDITNNKVCVVVVTFNRLQLLTKTISALKQQTYPIDTILIVNNGSTDGTLEWLNQQTGVVTFTQDNVGGAGGFYTGMDWAIKKDYDWVWVMDDDVMPDAGCLESFSRYFSEYKAMCPLRVYHDTNEIMDAPKEVNLNNPFKRMSYGIEKIYPGFKNLPDAIQVGDLTFEGGIFSTKLIRQIGLPRKEYFIFCDDVEYSLRITNKAKENIYLITSAVLYRLLPKATGEYPLWKEYYFYRNTSTLYQLYATNRLMVVFPLLKGIIRSVKSVLKMDFKRAKVIVNGTIDSYRKRFYNRYYPYSKF
jgi:GT2 family glycosyltransferase